MKTCSPSHSAPSARELARREIAVTEGASLAKQAALHLFLPLSDIPSLSLAALDSSLREGAGRREDGESFSTLYVILRNKSPFPCHPEEQRDEGSFAETEGIRKRSFASGSG